MIKGVNRQILEVTNTENPYFERIIFFVKPEYKNEDRKVLEKEAEKLSMQVKKLPKTRKSKKQIMRIIVRCLLFTLIGAAVTTGLKFLF